MAERNLDPDRYKAGEATIVRGRDKIALAAVPPGAENPHAATFIITNEDHTLGNALRWVMLQNPNVQLCAYTVPHPSEKQINVRVQTNGQQTAVEALQDGLETIKEISDHICATFKEKVAQHRGGSSMDTAS